MKSDMGAGARSAPRERRLLRLYIAGNAPNSAAALANLAALYPGNEAGENPIELEVVDVLTEPGRAFDDGIIVSPTLVRLIPLPIVRIVGNLNDHDAVRLAMGTRLST